MKPKLLIARLCPKAKLEKLKVKVKDSASTLRSERSLFCFNYSSIAAKRSLARNMRDIHHIPASATIV